MARRTLLVIGLVASALLAVFTIVQAQGDAPPPATSLLEVLQSQDLVGFQWDEKLNLYSFQLLSADVTKASEEWYAKEKENWETYYTLYRERVTLTNPRGESKDPEALKVIEDKLKKAARPTGNYDVGHITSRGTDFIGITKLNKTTETLIPYRMIGPVTRERE